MGKIWSEQDAQKWIDKHYPGAKFINFIRYQDGDQNRTDATVTCVECGDEFTKDWHTYRSRGSGRCQKCSRSHGGDWHKLSDEYLEQFVEENSNCKFIRSIRRKSEGRGAILYLELQCGEDECDNVFETTWNTFRDPKSCRMCPDCTDKIRRRTAQKNRAAKNNALEKCPSIADVWDYNKNKYGPEHYSAGSNANVWFICDKEYCQHEWNTSVSSVVQSILSGNNGCKSCLTKYKGYDVEKFNKELHDLHPHIDLISEFNGLKNPGTFHCNIDDYTWTTTAGYLIGYGKKKPTGCAVCSRKTIGPPPKYVNSIWADPIFSKDWAKYFDEEFMKTHTVQSSQYVDIPCPDCGKIKHTKICNLYHRGFRCTCNSRSSYPNKFMYSILDQLGINFTPEYQEEWTNGKQYDIYIKHLSLVIENHGIQHYEDNIFRNRTLREEQENDKYKYEIAVQNGIQNYVVIDCRYSEIEWIKHSIMNSNLPTLLNFSEKDIDWNQAEQNALKNIIREVCEEWEKERKYSYADYDAVGEKFHICGNTVQDYLIIGAKHGWCSYDSNWQLKKVYCFQFDKTWNSINEASAETGVLNSDISACCHKRVGYAGLHPETGEELVWCLENEKDTYVPRVNRARKSVTCLETMKEFRSGNAASKEMNIRAELILANCRGDLLSAGGYHFSFTNEITDEKIAFAKSHRPMVTNHLIYCVDTNTIYTSNDQITRVVGDWQVLQYLKGYRARAGKSGYDYKFIYDYTTKEGKYIPGAITLGLITEDQIAELTYTTQNN